MRRGAARKRSESFWAGTSRTRVARLFLLTPAQSRVRGSRRRPGLGRGRREVAALGASDNGAVIGSGRLSRRLQTSGSGQSIVYAGQAPRQAAPLAPLDITTLCLLPAARGQGRAAWCVPVPPVRPLAGGSPQKQKQPLRSFSLAGKIAASD